MNSKLRDILLKQSTARERVNVLGAQTELNDAEKTELVEVRNRLTGMEADLRAALADTGDGHLDDRGDGTEPLSSEEREAREIRSRTGIHEFVSAALQGKDPVGAAEEYAAAMGCPGLMPITLIGPTAEQRQREHRVVTPAPADTDVPSTHASIVPALFDRSIAAFLGIEMPTVGTGIQSYPVLSTNVTAGMAAEDADAVNTAGAFTVTDADPRRLSGAFTIRKEDIAKLPNLEESLRSNLAAVISDEYDKQGLNGNGTAPNLNGIFQQLTNPGAPAANAETFARYQTALSSHIDGLFAVMPTDVRALVGVHTLRHMLGVYRASEDATTAYDMAAQGYGGVRATRRIADPASNIQQAVIRLANPAGDRVAVSPVWMGLELIRDMYGVNAQKGQITVTGTALVGGIVLLRSGAFVQDSFRLP